METKASESSGYVHCAHECCFAIIIGKAGSVCEDCCEHDEASDAYCCAGCDNDNSDLSIDDGSMSDEDYERAYGPHALRARKGGAR
jgi:hypothetical protein